jgi:hypothetical protein
MKRLQGPRPFKPLAISMAAILVAGSSFAALINETPSEYQVWEVPDENIKHCCRVRKRISMTGG